MKHQLLGSLLFPIAWLVYCTVVLVQGGGVNGTQAAGVALGAVFLWLTGLLVLRLAGRLRLKVPGLALVGAAIFALDQAAKQAVYHLLGPGSVISIAGDFLQIRFAPNHSNNVLFNLLGIELGSRWLDALFKLATLLATAAVMVWYLRQQPALLQSGLLRLGLTLILAAGASSLLDTLVFGFVLDFVNFAGLVAFDLKDLYLQWGLALLILGLLQPGEGKEPAQKE